MALWQGTVNHIQSVVCAIGNTEKIFDFATGD